MAFVERLISAQFTLETGSFANGLNQLTIGPANLRISAKILKAGGASMGTLQASIFGMTLDHMNALSTLGLKVNVQPKNRVVLKAGDSSGLTMVFDGTIGNAFADFNSSPQVAFRVVAQAGLSQAVDSPQATSYKGGVDVATVMEQLAKQAGLAFDNNGVSVQLSNPYYSGSTREQMKAAAQEANIGWAIDNGILSIWPMNGTRKTKIISVSRTTGMKGYPAFTAQGVRVQTIFNPAIQFMGLIQIVSDVLPTSEWTVFNMEHDLDAHVPHGNWLSTLDCYNPAFPAPIAR